MFYGCNMYRPRCFWALCFCGIEGWMLIKKLERKIEAFERWLYHRMLKIHHSNEQSWGAESCGQGSGGALGDRVETPIFRPLNEKYRFFWDDRFWDMASSGWTILNFHQHPLLGFKLTAFCGSSFKNKWTKLSFKIILI